MLFKKRLNVPEQDNPYFTKTTYGGLNKAILGKPSLWKGSVLSNCVGQVIGRWMESQNITECDLSTGNAGGMFLKKDGYTRSNTPVLGGIICWHKTGGARTTGHVEFIEHVAEDGSITTSYSAYNGTAYATHILKKPYKKAGYDLQGFICPPVEFTETAFEVGDKVRITGTGNARADGTGHKAYGLGWKRTVLKIYDGKPFPYRVGSGKITTGYYPAESLKEVK